MKIQDIRNNKKIRLWTIGLLILVALILFFFAKTTWAKVIIGGSIALLMVAFGLEAKNTDYDVVQLVKTGSFAASQIQRDPETGNLLPESITAFCNAKEKDYNCADFKSQPEAQQVYTQCKTMGQNMDVYHLDGDSDGMVCEALPKMAH